MDWLNAKVYAIFTNQQSEPLARACYFNLTLKQEQATGNKPNGNSREERTTEHIIFDYAVLRFPNNTGVGVVSSIMP